MKRVLGLIYLGILISATLYGQGELGRGNKNSGRLDSISRPEEVEALVHEIDKRYANFRVNTELTFPNDFCSKLTKPTNAITNADLDNNGSTDILVHGTLGRMPVIFAILNTGIGKLSLNNITRSYSRLCSTALLLKDGQTTLVEYSFFKRPLWMYDRENTSSSPKVTYNVGTTKLIYKFDDFIEYNKSPLDHEIEKIEYFTDGGVWGGLKFSIWLNADGTAKQKADGFDTNRAIFTDRFNGLIPKNNYIEIADLLNYLDFTNLKDRYAIDASDHPSCRLTVTYDGGKVKMISDYGQMGTFGLQRVYQMMDALRGSRFWKLEVPKRLVPLPSIRN